MPDRERLLELALKGLEAERVKIDDEIAQIKTQLNSRRAVTSGGVRNSVVSTQPKKRRRMSAAARKKISEAMKRLYAERKKAATKSR